MRNCKCGKEISGKAKYCSAKCKQAAYRNAKRNESVTVGTVTLPESVTVDVVELIPNYGRPGCDCMHCKTNRVNGNRHTINHGKHKTADQLGDRELNRVTLPGDVDYKKSGVVEHCQSCDAILPQLSQPRVHTGTCYPCSSGSNQATGAAHTGHKTGQGQVTANG